MYNRIKELRVEKKITQEEIARTTGYSLSQIRNIEKNRSTPNLQLAFKIAEILGEKIEKVFIKKE